MSKRARERGRTMVRQAAVVDLVRPVREALGLTHDEAARVLKVDSQTIRYVWELDRSRPTGKRLARLERWILAAEVRLRGEGRIVRSIDELLKPEIRQRRAVVVGTEPGTPFAELGL